MQCLAHQNVTLTQSGFSITNNTGLINETTTTNLNAILGPSENNAEDFISGSISLLNGYNTIGAALRWNSSKEFYKALIDGKNLTIQKNVNGTVTKLKSVPFNATVSTLSAKVWLSNAQEPTNWMVTITDTSISSGYCGLRMQEQSGTTSSITFFQATSQ